MTTLRQDDGHQLSIINAIINQVLGGRADRKLLRRLRTLLLESLAAAAENVAAGLGIDPTVDIASPIAKKYFAERVPKLVGINTFTRRRIRAVLTEEIAAGSPLGRQIRRLRKEFRVMRRGWPGRRGLSRAGSVARTENGIAWGVGQHAQMLEAGVLAEIWITARDLRRRKSHVTMEGQCQPIGKPFVTGAGNLLMHPLDPAGRPEEVINCRCVAAPAPRGCEEARLATYRQRTRYWRTVIAQQRPHERALIRALRIEWLRQEKEMVAAMRKAA